MCSCQKALAALALWLHVLTFVLTKGIKNPLPNTIHPKEGGAGAIKSGRIALGLEDILLAPQTFGIDICQSALVSIVLVSVGDGG